jgi:hypothetical protein
VQNPIPPIRVEFEEISTGVEKIISKKNLPFQLNCVSKVKVSNYITAM